MIVGYTSNACGTCKGLRTHVILQVKGERVSGLVKVCIVCLAKKIRAGYLCPRDELPQLPLNNEE